MAIAAATVFEVRTGGADTNGGGFVTGASGTDFSQQNSAQYALTTVTTAAANAICLSASAAADMVGNICQIVSGTNFTVGLYQITSVSVGVSFTLDRTCTSAAGADGVINIGGAFATPGYAAPAATVDGNQIWVKAGTYTITTATPGAAGPVVLVSGARVKMEGYTTTRGDRAGRPVVSAGAVTTIMLFTGQGTDPQVFCHLEADGNSLAGVSGFSLPGVRCLALDCKASHCNQASCIGFSSVGGTLVRSGASDCTTGFSNATSAASLSRCAADACGTGFNVVSGSPVLLELCAATDCTGDGFILGLNGTTALNCTSEGNGGDGFDCQFMTYLCYCVATNNTGYGYNSAATTILEACAWLTGVGTARTNVACLDMGAVTLSGDPWTSAATDDLRPDNTAGEGASLRNTGGGVFGQTDNRDMGAVQHADPAGGVTAHVIGG